MGTVQQTIPRSVSYTSHCSSSRDIENQMNVNSIIKHKDLKMRRSVRPGQYPEMRKVGKVVSHNEKKNKSILPLNGEK